MATGQGNRKKQKWRGEEYDSKFELDVAKKLDQDRRALKYKVKHEGDTLDYQPPPPPPRKYHPDFTITRQDNSWFVIEVKGYFDAAARKKMIAVKECNPDVEICFVFQNDSKLHRSATWRYSDWCKRYGFDYSFGEPKREWFQCEQT